MASIGFPTRRVLAASIATAMALSACGGDDGGGGADGAGPGITAVARDVDTSGATLGSAGHWAALELCALTGEDAVGAVHAGITVNEVPGRDDPDGSVCQWDDVDGDPLVPESNLITVTNSPNEGLGLDDTAERVDLAGADDAVLFPASDGGGGIPPSLVVDVGDQRLAVDYRPADGAPELAEAIATVWLEAQTSAG